MSRSSASRAASRNDVSGNLNLTTVGVSRGGLSLVQAVRGWFDDEVAVVPEESVYPPDRSEEETRQANREAFLTSEQAAETVALGHLGYPVKVVVQERAGGLAVGRRCSRRATPSTPSTAGRPRTPTPSSEVLTVDPGRHGRSRSTTRGSARRSRSRSPPSAAEDREGSLLGVSVLEQPSAPFDVQIQVEDVGGPSAGLMLTLGILDLVGDDDLTDGAVDRRHRHDRRARATSGRSAGSR